MHPGKYIMVAVSDTGMGMDAETQTHLFVPFYTTKEHGRGTGLGLSTIYGIIKQSNGYVWVYSELGKGTTFKIYLPQTGEKSETEKTSQNLNDKLNGHETILIVEDEEMARSLAVQILQKNGYNVLEAQGGDAAIEVCKSHRGQIHLMLTDVVMPNMNGCELSKQVAPVRPDVNVLYMSGYTEHAVYKNDLLDPEENFIQKPFTISSDVSKIRSILDRTKV
jgi:CheY-like chemotaxis protein